ncbi:MAG: VWA domain-containing protein [Peptostreptococcus sp.]|uniref:vWA domain-containing protein n=1 Tax=Peptostreptococcus sp. TaxID=1262 RepID=UPI002FCCAAAE
MVELLDEERLIEISKKNLEKFLDSEARSLASFTLDPSLMYVAEAKLEKFVFKASKGILYLPLASFLEEKIDHQQMLWHIYYELALYPDWKKNTKNYAKRYLYWDKEIESVTFYIMKKVEKVGLEDDEAYQASMIKNYVKREIMDFLYTIDRYISFLRVLQLCPTYRKKENFLNIVDYMKKTGRTMDSITAIPKHYAFSKGFLLYELYNERPDISNTENPFKSKVFNMDYFDFIRSNFIEQINSSQGIKVREEFVRTFVYSEFERLWKEEIDAMTLFKSKGKTKDELKKGKSSIEGEEKELPQNLELSRDEQDEILEEMLDDTGVGGAIGDTQYLDLVSYGISQSDQEIFDYYANKMKYERDEMQKFWRELVGNAKKEVSKKKKRQAKGKIDIDSFIQAYPDFVEAEKKANYRNLPIFSRYLLEVEKNILPSKIEISFLIDNSGSMNPMKIDAARKALSVTLLSIEDFNRYLLSNSDKLNQSIKVYTETWFFGSGFYNVKKFNEKSNNEKEKSDIIKSIIKLNASDGATDDAGCLKKINDSISKKQEKDLKKGSEIKIIFEITDGASSFPGLAKNEIDSLKSKNVFVYGFQIGKISEKSKETFNFIWNEGTEERGIILGEEVNRLPRELLKLIRLNMKSIFI